MIAIAWLSVIQYRTNRRRFVQIRRIASFAQHHLRDIHRQTADWLIAKRIVSMQTNNPPLHLQEQEIENAFLALEEDFYQIDMLLNNYRFSWSHLAFHFKNAWLDIKLHLDGIDKSRSLDTLNSEFEAIYIELVDALNALETKILL